MHLTGGSKYALVVGDCHFSNHQPNLLENQFKTLDRLLRDYHPTVIVFLGDVFHARNPDPATIVGVHKFFQGLGLKPGLKEIIILRGNHDSANKSDDGLTVLSTLVYPGSKIRLVLQPEYDCYYKFLLIPHLEDHKKLCHVVNDMTTKHAKDNPILFGHFGYNGCINSMGYMDFHIEKETFNGVPTILGHIHQYKKDGNITILGTPWSTNFGEVDYDKFIAAIPLEEDYELIPIRVDQGIRHHVSTYGSLDLEEASIRDPNYFTYLRVIVDKFDESLPADYKRLVKERLNVEMVDLKIQPVLDKKLNNRLSNYDPQKALEIIETDVIDLYLDEQSTTIPTDLLRSELEEINKHADQDN